GRRWTCSRHHLLYLRESQKRSQRGWKRSNYCITDRPYSYAAFARFESSHVTGFFTKINECNELRKVLMPGGVVPMTFHSILFERTEDSIKKETLEAPVFFVD